MSTPWPQPHRTELYVDEVQYVVRVTPHPSGDREGIVEGYVVWWDEMGVGLDEASTLAPGVAWNAEKGYFEAHVAKQEFTQFEWGASGYGLQFVVDLTTGMATEAVMAVFQESYDDLSTIEATQADGNASVVVAGAYGRYVATVGTLKETGDPYCHVRRL